MTINGVASIGKRKNANRLQFSRISRVRPMTGQTIVCMMVLEDRAQADDA